MQVESHTHNGYLYPLDMLLIATKVRVKYRTVASHIYYANEQHSM